MDEYADLREQKKDIEARLKELDPIIRPALDGVGNVVHGGWMYSLTVSEGRKTLDKSALLEAGIDLDPYYKVGAPFTTLKIAKVKEA